MCHTTIFLINALRISVLLGKEALVVQRRRLCWIISRSWIKLLHSQNKGSNLQSGRTIKEDLSIIDKSPEFWSEEKTGR